MKVDATELFGEKDIMLSTLNKPSPKMKSRAHFCILKSVISLISSGIE